MNSQLMGCSVARLSKHRQNSIFEEKIFGWSWNETLELFSVRKIEEVALIPRVGHIDTIHVTVLRILFHKFLHLVIEIMVYLS